MYYVYKSLTLYVKIFRMSIIVRSFQKYAHIPDFLLKFQDEVKVRLDETLSTDPRATVAETVLRFISAQFWPQNVLVNKHTKL